MSEPGRPVALIGAPSSVGIRPYDDDGAVREIYRTPAVLRELKLAERVRADDLGDVLPPPYVDFERPPGGARNEAAVAAYSRALAERIAATTDEGKFTLLIGGECSIVLGALLGASRGTGAQVGLAYVDGHADFATPSESITGSVASMCLALAVGRGDSPLARLSEGGPLVDARDTALIGRRDDGESWYGNEALAKTDMLDISAANVKELGGSTVATAALGRLARPGLGGFWIHVDADVLDPVVMPAVDSPDPGGLSLDTVAELLVPLVQHPNALGLELTIYDPGLDPDGTCARRLVTLLERVLAGRHRDLA